MSNRVPYNTATGRAFYNPETGRALYIDQHVISAFSGTITFEYGDSESPSTLTCYDGPNYADKFGFRHNRMLTGAPIRVSNLNKIGFYNESPPVPTYYTSYSLEYLPSREQLVFSFLLVEDSTMPHWVSKRWEYLGCFGQSSPTVGIDGVYDAVVFQRCSYDRGPSQTTDQTFAFTISS